MDGGTFLLGLIVHCWNAFLGLVVATLAVSARQHVVRAWTGFREKMEFVDEGVVVMLREDERLELIYDQDRKLRAIQKIRLSKVFGLAEGRSATNIPPLGEGYVWYKGSSWKARSDSLTVINAGQKIVVKARYNLTLLVMPME
jgi:NfeD-like C-terminal, partner-binding